MWMVVSHSADPLTAGATGDVVEGLRRDLRADPAALLVFAGIDHDHTLLLAGLAAAWPGVPLVGCTTDGELSSAAGYQEGSVVVAALGGPGLVARAALLTDLDRADPASAAPLSDVLRSIDRPRLCLVFAEGLGVNASFLLGLLTSTLGTDVPIVGGTAGDAWRFESTRQLFGAGVHQRAAAVLVLSGNVDARVGVASGWTPLGAVGVVTRSEGNLLHEIDSRPATAFYQRYFGPNVEYSSEHPLGVLGDGDVLSYLRAPAGSDPRAGTVVMTADVPRGARVQVTKASRDEILSGCERALGDTRAGDFRATGALVVSCAARKQVLGTRTGEEAGLVSATLGHLPTIGFYSYGEFGPDTGACSRFHNETVVVVVFGGSP